MRKLPRLPNAALETFDAKAAFSLHHYLSYERAKVYIDRPGALQLAH